MKIQVFNQDLDGFCQKYMFSDRIISVADHGVLPAQARQLFHGLFEQLLIFDTVSFKVTGENVGLALLIGQIGLKGVERLLDENALKFVLWQQTVMSLVEPAAGVQPLCIGMMNSPAHSDPEASIESGLKFLQDKIPASRLKKLVPKILPHYIPQPDNLAKDAVDLTNSAYMSGRLVDAGIPLEGRSLENIPKQYFDKLLKCANEMLEYKLLVRMKWSSTSNFTFHNIFSESVRRLTTASSVSSGFRYLSNINNIPNFSVLFENIKTPLESIPRIRAKRSSERFRQWIATGDGESPEELTRRYIEAIGGSRGFFERGLGKFTKSLAMTGVGAGVGALIEAGLPATAAGALAGKALEPLADIGLDLLDAYLLDGLLTGWTPRMFFADIKSEIKSITRK
ncbi:hypothetical protein JK169_11855 [Acetobacter persici]|uniref:hypothetical protein n=1 Tax=Acetobacter persici TaxID=1076596 RepID=UPI001BADBC37|nr:hypothetical protein [Acetobacter persici]MBS1001690.1 hypothetical protein [Acetobacter persici]